jgi:hypothetical protein
VAHRRNWLLLAGLLAAVAAGVVVLVSLRSSGGGQGPLAAKIGGRNSRIGVAQPAAAGQAISISGPFIVQNTGDQAVVLDRVDLVGLPRGIYRGAYVLPWPPNRTPFTGALTYHVPRDGRLMPGATVAPHAYAWIVVGLTARRGRHQWTRADIVYHDGGTTYRRHAALAGAVCAPLKKYLTSCEIPGFQDPR